MIKFTCKDTNIEGSQRFLYTCDECGHTLYAGFPDYPMEKWHSEMNCRQIKSSNAIVGDVDDHHDCFYLPRLHCRMLARLAKERDLTQDECLKLLIEGAAG